jgi:hypothetical protein
MLVPIAENLSAVLSLIYSGPLQYITTLTSSGTTGAGATTGFEEPHELKAIAMPATAIMPKKYLISRFIIKSFKVDEYLVKIKNYLITKININKY